MSRLARLRALATFEVRQQFREPLTALYALVLFLLMLGFSSGGAVELVNARGAVSRTSEWSLWLAFGGLTAFAQVISTMVVVTAVLRDHATRVTDQLITSGVGAREWLAARLVAAATVLLVVYLAMPLGAWLGAVFSSEVLDGVPARIASAYVVLTLPSMLVVTVLVGVTAALTRRPLGGLAMALVLLGLWQLALALEARETSRMLGAVLDPFGNAPVLAATRGWAVQERGERSVALGGLLLGNRAAWSGVALVALAVGCWRVRWAHPESRLFKGLFKGSEYLKFPRTGGFKYSYPLNPGFLNDPSAVVVTATRRTRTRPGSAIASFTAEWIRRDGGWRVVAGLAAANGLLNAWFRFDPNAAYVEAGIGLLAAFLDAIREHARVFLIVLATVYAGELLWRDRDARVADLVDAMPVSTRVMALGRLLGLARAQGRVVAWLSSGALLMALAMGLVGRPSDLALWLLWTVAHVWAPFLQWTILSLVVHVIVRHKVGAHLALITGWVLSVVLDRRGAQDWWYRYAEPAPLMEGSGFAWTAVLLRCGYWMLIASVLVPVIIRWWPRGTATDARLLPVTSRR